MKRLFAVIFLLAFLISLVMPGIANAGTVSTVVCPSECGGATQVQAHADNKSVLYSNGLYWTFLTDLYRTSADGQAWSATTTLLGGNVTSLGYNLAVNQLGDIVVLAASGYWNGRSAIVFREGETQSSGNISWFQDWQLVEYYPYDYESVTNVSIGIDYTGHVWVGLVDWCYYTMNTSHLWVMGSSATDGTWSTDTHKTATFGTYGGYVGGSVVMVGLTDTCAVLYSANNSYILARIYRNDTLRWSDSVQNGSECLSVTDGGSGLHCEAFFSATLDHNANIVDVAFEDTSGNIKAIILTTSPWGVFSSHVTGGVKGEDTLMVGCGNAAPSITQTTYNHDIWVWWENYPSPNYLYECIYHEWTRTWSAYQAPYEETGGLASAGFRFNVIAPAPDDRMSVLYQLTNGGESANFFAMYGNGTGVKPFGLTETPESIMAQTATLKGYCSYAGANCTASFQLYVMDASRNPVPGTYKTVTFGACSSAESISAYASGLIPDSYYCCYMILTNASGTFDCDPVYFVTLKTVGATTPIVHTLDATDVHSDGATINGYLDYDGGVLAGAQVGFEYRVQGSTDWIPGWGTDFLKSQTHFKADLYSLLPNTVYEFMAMAQNQMGAVDGNDTHTFTTNVTGTKPGGTTTVKIGTFSIQLSANQKIAIGIFATLLLMLAVGYMMRKSRGGAAIGMGGVVIGMVIMFTVIGWFPSWIIIFIGMLAGFGVLIMLGGKI